MRKKGAFAAMAALMALGAWGQTGDVGLTLRLLTSRVLPGEPLFLEIGLHNGTSAPVSLYTGDDGGPGFQRQMMMRKPDGTVAVVQWPSADMPMHPLTPGQSAVFRDDLGGSELLLLTSPGKYELWAEYESPGRVYWQGEVYGRPRRYTDYWKGSLKSNTCSFEVIEPQGEDRQAYDGWLKPYATGEKSLMGKYRGRETVLVDGRKEYRPINLLNEILRQYPTSTYAGYVLVKMGGGMSLQEASRVTPEVRDSVWYVPSGATLEKQEEHRRAVRKKYEEFVSRAQTFLTAHPDFSQRALLRKQLAIKLFYLDRTQEAWSEVESLSKLDGAWAEEAKDLLESKPPARKCIGAG